MLPHTRLFDVCTPWLWSRMDRHMLESIILIWILIINILWI